MNSTETPPFDNQLGAPDPVYTELLNNLPPAKSPCGHARRWRKPYSGGCLACEIEALVDTERPEEFRKPASR